MPAESKAIATRQKIIDASAELFHRKGFTETSIKDITRAAGLTSGAFYYHFDSKDQLAVAIIEQTWPEVYERIIRRLGRPESGLANVISASFEVIDLFRTDRAAWVGFHLDLAFGHLSPAGRDESGGRMEMFIRLVASAFRAREIREGMPLEEVARLIWVLIIGCQLSSDARREDAVATLHSGWRALIHAFVPADSQEAFQTFLVNTVVQFSNQPAGECATAESVLPLSAR